jgi:N-sulfoglucosamine sulfohydrolase
MRVIISLRTFSISTWFVLSLPFCWSLFGQQQIGSQQPNIVLIVTDDHSLDLGCYGNSKIRTPNLDALAAEGTRFQYAFATTASCSASRSVLLTGMYNHANGHYGHEHAYHHFSAFEKLKSLPTHLSAAGYQTVRIGKLHVAPEAVFHFDTTLQANQRNTVQMAEQVDGYLAKRATDKPFFLYFCPVDPHRADQFRDDLPNKPDSFGNVAEGYPGVREENYDPKLVNVPNFLPDNEVTRTELAMYYQSISRVDQGIGRLVQSLKARGVWDNTIVIFTADHGMAFPGAKTTVYDPGLRIPLIVRDSRISARNLVNTVMVSMVDIAPTILKMAGVEKLPNNFQGRSFAGIVDRESAEGWDKIYASHTFHEVTMYYPMKVVRDREYKLIWNIAHPLPFPFASDLWAAPTWQHVFKQGSQARYGQRTVDQYINRPAFELYDLESDPDEAINLALDPNHTDLLHKLKNELRDFQKRTNDPWILKWDYE